MLDLDQSHGQRPPEQWADATSGRDVLRRLTDAADRPIPLPTYTGATPSVINGSVRVLFNGINDWNQWAFASLIHCYQGVCNNEYRMHRVAGSEDP
ncbi:hypothetical protein OHB12_08115 [Nocardia sp. NBC_01730]|uniref:hypothetical protein n=1 Tax=Nocardia sp. NBC_01730 TaxID=2975998 RepID=UPI002E1028F1|nr:hypothetical protein OHB12_08115 [Nocardia sp. NBC_01730]